MKMVEWEREKAEKQERRHKREKRDDDSSVCGDGCVLVMQSELS